MDQIVKKNGLVLGLIGAAITISLYLYIWKNQDFQNITIGIITLIIPVAIGLASQIYSKNKLGGYITLKQTVLAFFLSVLIIFVSEAVINYLIYVVWDPGAQETVRLMQEAMVAKEREASNAAVQVSEIDYSIKGYAKAATSKLLFYTVIGILAAFFIKKNPPQA